MKPITKYNALMGAAMFIGFGGFIALAMLVLPKLDKGSILGPLLFLAWGLIVFVLLYLRYRVAKNSEEITAQNKKEAEEIRKRVEAREAKRAGITRSRRRGMYGEEIRLPGDEKDDGESEMPAEGTSILRRGMYGEDIILPGDKKDDGKTESESLDGE